MARHRIDGKGKVSKGLRVSCSHVKRSHPNTHTEFPEYETNMRLAMRRALLRPDVNRKLGRIVVNAEAKHHPGIIKLGKGWNAHLSLRTYQTLRIPCGL